MPATYTSSLRLTKPAVGDTNWGTTVNSGFTDLTDSAIAGYTTVSMPSNADYTLTSVNGAADEARSMMLNITSAVSLTATRNIICPTASKLYIVKNATTGSQSITVKTSAGSGVTIPTGKTMIVMCNGTDVVVAFDAFNGTVGATTPSTGAFTTLSYTGTLTGGTGIVNLGSGQFYKDASGRIGIGSTSVGGGSGQIRIGLQITGAASAPGVLYSPTIQSDVTTQTALFQTYPSTAASAFTLTTLFHYLASITTAGAGSTIGSVYGFVADSSIASGSTGNYGFYSSIASSTNNWAFYGANTAPSYFGGNVGIGANTNLSTLRVEGSFAAKAPSNISAAAYTVLATDYSLRFTTTNCTVTLPTASSYPGRILVMNTITANSVISASSNVKPLGSDTAGTAILAATAGKFSMLQSDGSNWIVLMSN